MLTRRQFAAVATSALASPLLAVEPAPVIDTHTHFYDPTRKDGVDWPGKGDKTLYRPVLPPEFVKLVKPHGVMRTVVVEASPRLADNDWLLDLANAYPVIIGVVGRLDVADAKFGDHLKRLAKRRKYRGFRINEAELKAALADKTQADKFALVADAGLTLDVNGGPTVLPFVAELAKLYPKLGVVLNHIGNVRIDGKIVPETWAADILALGDRPAVSCKVSALVEGTGKLDGKAPKDVAFYAPTLDVVFKAFGPDRLMYGSNWPVADLFAPYATVFGIVEQYLKDKPAATRAKVWGGNAAQIYGVFC